MSGPIKRVLRQRMWGGDKVAPRSVGESLRNAESAILSQPSTREVEIANQAYADGGIVFAHATRPRGAIVIYVERGDGTWQAVNAVPELAYAGGVVTAKISGLTTGEHYATIRLLVIG